MVNETARPATYSNLQAGEIRLLKLHAGEFNEEVLCELAVVSLESDPQYEALSYVWGDPSVTRTIQLCGAPHQVTVNLDSALRHIRSETEERTLWIDALCINQEDVAERGAQVNQMGRIYASAERVLAWLGDLMDDGDLVFDGVERLVSNPKLHWTKPRKSKTSSGEEKYFEAEKILPGFADFANRPWWKRVWIVQEALLANNLIFLCGRRSLSATAVIRFNELHLQHVFEDRCCQALDGKKPENWIPTLLDIIPILRFRSGITADVAGVPALENTSKDPEQRSNRLAQIMALEWEQEPDKDRYFRLFDQVCDYRARLCTDPRDKIYGLLSLVSDLRNDFPPDYSLSCDEVYADFAFNIMKEQDNLDILTLLIPGQSERSQPTWAPDWRYETKIDDSVIKPRQDDRTLYERFNNLCHFNAAVGVPCAITRISKLVLSAEGCIFDEIQFMSSFRYGYPYGSPAHPSWPAKFANIWNTDCGDLIVNMKTAIGALLGYPRATGTLVRRSKFYLQYQNFMASKSLKVRSFVSTARKRFMPHKLEDWWEAADVFDEAMWLRKYAITREDFVGFVPYVARPGDKICILFGGRVPFVLREMPGEVEVDGVQYPKYAVLGDCYIDGFMQGEAVKLMEKGEKEKQRIFLC